MSERKFKELLQLSKELRFEEMFRIVDAMSDAERNEIEKKLLSLLFISIPKDFLKNQKSNLEVMN